MTAQRENDGTTGAVVAPDAGQPSSGKGSISRQFLDYAVHISFKYRYLYVVNPKVGCSSILWTLQRLEADDRLALPATMAAIHDRSHSSLKQPSEVDEFWEIARDPTFYRFTFVRNPFDRLMSCYLQKIARPTAQRRILVQMLGRPADDAEAISFEQFVRAIAQQRPTQMDPHWRVQWVQTLQETIHYDAIGRFENFDRELSRIGARISPDFDAYLHSERRQATGPKPYHLITPPLADMIRETFAQDFRGFGYSLEVPAG